jgi:copper transport outer membrane protein MctB
LISFRYHLVTIVAVFLALGLGLLAGTTVINRVLVKRLQTQTNNLQQRATTAEAQAAELKRQVDELVPYLMADKLPGTNVVLVTYEGSDGNTLDRTESSLKAAGANVVGVLPVTSRTALTDPDAVKALAKIVGAPQNTPVPTLQEELAADLARRLSSVPPRPGGDGDLLGQLVSQGFIRKGDTSPATLRAIGQPGDAVVAVTGGSSKLDLKPQAFMVPLVEQLVGKMPVAAGESTHSADPFIPLLRDDGSVNPQELVTVDDLDRQIGGAALVLGLDQLMRSPADGGGSYGLDGGTLIPTPVPTP